MNYVRCVNNRKYLYFPEEPRHVDDTILGLEIGQVYKLAPPEANDGITEARVIDDTGEDYLYPLYFALAGFVICSSLENHKSCPTAV